MTRARSAYLAMLAVLLSPLAANADLIELRATSVLSHIDDFTVLFDDTGDGLLQWDEIVDFGPPLVGFYDLLVIVPNLVGISTFSFDPSLSFTPTEDLYGSRFYFQSSVNDGLAICTNCWTFSLETVSVPEPGTLALFAIGLLGVGAARHRKKA